MWDFEKIVWNYGKILRIKKKLWESWEFWKNFVEFKKRENFRKLQGYFGKQWEIKKWEISGQSQGDFFWKNSGEQ